MRRYEIPIGLYFLCAATFAQQGVQFGPERAVYEADPNEPRAWLEPTVAAARSQDDKCTICAIHYLDPSLVATSCRTTLDGGVTFEQLQTLVDIWGDPGLVVDPATDRIWLTGNGQAFTPNQNYIMGVWKEPNDPNFDPGEVRRIVGNFKDKPLPAIGLAPGGSTMRFHVVYEGVLGDPNSPVWAAFTDDPYSDPNSLWLERRVEPTSNDPGPDYQNRGAMPVVTDLGRVVVANRGFQATGQPYNDGLPYVVYSEDPNGVDWLPDDPNDAGVAQNSGIVIAQTIDTDNLDRRSHFPAIAVRHRPNDDDFVYVAFYARKDLDDDAPVDRNTDIYIALSTNDGQTFPTDAQHLLQLTDELIGIDPNDVTSSGPDQLMPAVAVDGCGGVNVMFYDNRNPDGLSPDDGHWWDAWFVRITNFGPNPTIFQRRLTDASFRYLAPLGDYHHMAAGGPKPVVYPAYIAMRESSPGNWNLFNCYTRKIRILCLSDGNQSGDPDPEDVSLFLSAFDEARSNRSGSGHADAVRRADLTADGVVDLRDYDLFWDQYLNGCNED